MDALAFTAEQLTNPPQEHDPEDDARGSKTARMRRELQQNGGALAKHLAKVAGLSSSALVGGLLKHDIQQGRVQFKEGRYWWNGEQKAPRAPRPGALCETLEWREVADGNFPDADLTVIGRLRDNEEPVWLVYWDDEEWRDIDGQVVDVVRWCDMPRGGEV